MASRMKSDCSMKINSLPNELLCEIFEKLPFIDQAACMCVCSKWCHIVRAVLELPEAILEIQDQKELDIFCDLLQNLRNLQNLSIRLSCNSNEHDESSDRFWLLRIFSHCQELKSLKLIHNTHTPSSDKHANRVLADITDAFRVVPVSLSKLHIFTSGIPVHGGPIITHLTSRCFSSLVELSIQLTDLRSLPNFFETISQAFYFLRYLYIHRCYLSINDEQKGVWHVSKLAHLEELDLFDTEIHMTDESVKLIVDNCPGLVKFGLTSVFNSSSPTADGLRNLKRAKHLEVLLLENVPLSDDVMEIIGQLMSLRDLSLVCNEHWYMCESATETGLLNILHLTHLEKLWIHGVALLCNKILVAFAQYLPSLLHISMDECYNMTLQGVKSLAMYSKTLQIIDIERSFEPENDVDDTLMIFKDVETGNGQKLQIQMNGYGQEDFPETWCASDTIEITAGH